MLKAKRRHWIGKKILFSLIYLALSIILIKEVTQFFVENQIKNQRNSLTYELSSVVYQIEANIFRHVFLADSLATLVSIQPQFAMDNWQHVAANLISKAEFVRNIGLAPNDVIAKVYPLKGNEAAIGLDFRTVPAQYLTVMKAREQQSVYIAGPLELVQGGMALIARYPIFNDIPQKKNYWGGLSIVIDYHKLLSHAQFYKLDGLDVALERRNPHEVPKLIEGKKERLSDYDIKQTIHLPDGQWLLYAKFGDFTQHQEIANFRSIFLIFGGVTCFVVYLSLLSLFNNYIKIREHSLHDELTQLPNRRFLFQELNRIRNKKHKTVHVTLLSIDLNDFKAINDTYGHDAGDAVLRFVASKITSCLAPSDFFARMGGDEFIVVLQRALEPTDIRNIHGAIDYSPLLWRGHRIWVSASIGSHTFTGKASQLDIQDMFLKVDRAMYEEKSAKKYGCDFVI